MLTRRSMSRALRWTAGLLAGLALLPVDARAESKRAASGFSAVQVSATPGSTNAQRAEVSYGHHKLRIDQPGQQRLIVDFATGALTVMDVAKKQYARVTLEEMVAIRNRQVEIVRSRLGEMPPEIRKQMEAQLAEVEKTGKRSLRAKATDERATISGVDCRVYSWTGDDGDGRACMATRVPFDAKAFQADSLALSRKMNNLGAGSAAASMVILQLGEHGFPMRIDQKVRLGGQLIEVSMTFENLKGVEHAPGHFEPPAEFTKRGFEEMMAESVAAPPVMPPVKK